MAKTGELADAYEEIRDLEKQCATQDITIAEHIANVNYQKNRADRLLEEVHGYKKDIERTKWLIDHLIDYAHDMERLAKEDK